MASAQGKFYAHQATAKDLTYCPAPQRIETAAVAQPVTSSSRTLASRTDIRVCEPPRKLGVDGPNPFAPQRLDSVTTAPPKAQGRPQQSPRRVDAPEPWPGTPDGHDAMPYLSLQQEGREAALRAGQPPEAPLNMADLATSLMDSAAESASTMHRDGVFARSVALSNEMRQVFHARGKDQTKGAAAFETRVKIPPVDADGAAERTQRAEEAYARSRDLSRKMTQLVSKEQLVTKEEEVPTSSSAGAAAASTARDEARLDDEKQQPFLFPPPPPALGFSKKSTTQKRAKAPLEEEAEQEQADFGPPPMTSVTRSDGAVVVTVGPLLGVASAAELDLELQTDALRLGRPNGAPTLDVQLPRSLDPTKSRIQAKFKKVTATLKVTIHDPTPAGG